MAEPSSDQTLIYAPIEGLPSLITDEICELLVADDQHDLFSFSRASPICAALSRRVRLRRIHLQISHSERLTDDLNHLEYALRSSSFGLLRQLKLTGQMDETRRPEKGKRLLPPPLEGENYFRLPLTWNTVADYDPTGIISREEKEHAEVAWRPLAEFVGQLSLADLVYGCLDQIPRCLLEALHQHSPSTRLYMHTFSLRSLYQPQTALHDIDSDEYLLATSPCLHSIACKHLKVSRDGRRGFNYEAIQAMLAGAAPNLRHLTIDWEMGRSPDPGLNVDDISWNGFFGEGPVEYPPPSKTRLASLTCSNDCLPDLLERVEINELEMLCIMGALDDVSADTLLHAARTKGFKKLSSWTVCSSFDLRGPHPHEFTIGLFLRRISPLTHLDITGTLPLSVIEAIWLHHGKSLKTLRLFQTEPIRLSTQAVANQLTYATFRDWGARLPHIEELHLYMQRGQTGNFEGEVGMYRIIGQCRKLRTFFLTLNVGNPDWVGPGFHDKIPATVFGHALIRSAIDADLVRSIFDMIRGEDGVLEYLEVQISNACAFGLDCYDGQASNILSWISPSWMCEQEPGQEVCVRELEHTRSDPDEVERSFAERADLREVWDQLWPQTEDGEDRRYNWSSFPLEVAAETES